MYHLKINNNNKIDHHNKLLRNMEMDKDKQEVFQIIMKLEKVQMIFLKDMIRNNECMYIYIYHNEISNSSGLSLFSLLSI